MRHSGAVALLVVLSACGGSGGGSQVQPTVVAVSVNITPSSTTLFKIGGDQTYTATVHWSDNTDTLQATTWQSDNTNVATIAASLLPGTGKAHGVDSGEATLIAKALNLTGTLKIRIVPDYQGTWDGDYLVRSCTAVQVDLDFALCGTDRFKIGDDLPIKLVLTQDNDKLTGTITLGTIVVVLDATSVIKVDGGASMSGRGNLQLVGGLVVTVAMNPVSLRAQGPTMHGTFTVNFSLPPGAGDSATIDAELGTVTRTSSITMPDLMMPTELSRPTDVIRLMRQR